jgi:hypothetical protein
MADDLFRHTPHGPAERRVDGDKPILDILEKDALLEVFDQGTVARLAGSQGLLGLASLEGCDTACCGDRLRHGRAGSVGIKTGRVGADSFHCNLVGSRTLRKQSKKRLSGNYSSKFSWESKCEPSAINKRLGSTLDVMSLVSILYIYPVEQD